MGLFLHCNINFKGVEENQWNDIYEESLQIIKNFPVPLIDVITENIFEEKRYSYTTEIIHNRGNKDEHWGTIGDLISRKRAEYFSLYRHLDHYLQKDHKNNQLETDVLYADENFIDYIDSHNTIKIFYNKTQGYPYHIALMAIALMIENRLPSQAYIHGNITQGIEKLIVKWLNSFLKKPVIMPVCMDSDRLWQRLSQAYQDDDLTTRRFETLYLGSRENSLKAIAQYCGKPYTKKYLINNLQRYNSLSQLGAKEIVFVILECFQDLDLLIDIVRDISVNKGENKEFSLEDLLKLLMQAYITLSAEEKKVLTLFDMPCDELVTIEESMGRTLAMLSGMPDAVNMYVAKYDLLKAFCKYEPENKPTFKNIITEAHQKNKEEISELEELMKLWQKTNEEKCKEECTENKPKLLPIPANAEFIVEEALSQQERFKDADKVAKNFGEQLREQAKKSPLRDWLDIETKEGLLKKIYCASSESGFALKASAWKEIDEENDLEILKGVFALSLIKNNEMSFWHFRIHILEEKSLREFLKIF